MNNEPQPRVKINSDSEDPALQLAQQLAEAFGRYPSVELVTLSGSRTSGAVTDSCSDIDLFIYTADGTFPLPERQAIIARLGGAARQNLGLTFWGPLADSWFDARSGIEVDVVYTDRHWTEEAIDRILRRHQPSGGYSTCSWHAVRSAAILFERSSWFREMQTWCQQPYPPELRQAIIAHNLPILRAVIPSYRYNVQKSLLRRDLLFINNEITWLLASYFDVLFAFNWVAHPGSKRLLAQVERLCPLRPADLESQVNAVLRLGGLGDAGVLDAIDALVDGLENLLRNE